MPDPRTQDHRNGPERVASFGHLYGDLHDRVVGDDSKDDTFYSGISHKAKAGYICQAVRLAPSTFNLDHPLPLEDWAKSEDMSLIYAGLYLASLRRDFYAALFQEEPDTRHGAAWGNYAEAEFWNHEFNVLIHKRNQGLLLGDPRVLH